MKSKTILRMFAVSVVIFLFTSCGGDSGSDNPDAVVSGFEVYGDHTSYNGVFVEREDKEDWYVREDDDRYVIKKISMTNWAATNYEGPGWILLYDNESLTFRNLVDSDYPPEFDWTCGYGVDKEFYVRTLTE